MYCQQNALTLVKAALRAAVSSEQQLGLLFWALMLRDNLLLQPYAYENDLLVTRQLKYYLYLLDITTVHSN